MNGVSEDKNSQNKIPFNLGAMEFKFETKMPPSFYSLNITADEFIPLHKIALNIEAKEFSPEEKSANKTKENTLKDNEKISIVTLKLEETNSLPIKEMPKETIEEEEKKIDTKCKNIEIESIKIITDNGDAHESNHSDPFINKVFSARHIYTSEEIFEAYKAFSSFEEFSILDKKLEEHSHRKCNISLYRGAGRSGSPRKNNKNQKRDIIRVEEYKASEMDSWRKKKSLEEKKLLEAAKKTTLKLTTTIEENEKIKRKIKVTLNKLSPNNLEKLQVELLALGKQSRIALNTLIEYIFDKA